MLYASLKTSLYDFPFSKVLDKELDEDLVVCYIWDFTVNFVDFENDKF